MIPRKAKTYRVSRKTLWEAGPPRSIVGVASELIPRTGLSALQAANLVAPVADRLWIMLHACGLQARKCLVFARICALRTLRLWTGPYPEHVARYLRTGKRALLPEAREAVLPLIGDAESAARWAIVVPLIDFDRIDLKIGRWAKVSPASRADKAAASARKAGAWGESQIMDLLTVMRTHPSVLARLMASGSFESTGGD